MSYLDDVEKDLRPMLGDFGEEDKEANDWAEDVVKYVRAKLLEFFKNGAQAARKQMGKAQTPKQKSPTGNRSKA